MAVRHVSHDLRLPWTEFYWAVIDPAADAASGRSPHDALRALALQAELPVPVEDLEVVWADAGEGRSLACAMPTPTLVSILQTEHGRRKAEPSLGPPLLSLGPACLPERLRQSLPTIDASAINLLVGRFTPDAVRRLRSRTRRWAIAYAAVLILLFGAGARWRALEANEHAASLRDQARAIVLDAGLPTASAGGGADALSRAASLVRRARGPEAESVVPRDAVESLAVLLSHWPEQVEARTGRLSVSHRVLSLAVQVADESQAHTLSDALARCDGWTLEPPRTQRAASGLQVSLTLKRAEEAR